MSGLMNNIKRKGVDISASFSLASKRMQYETMPVKNIKHEQNPPIRHYMRNQIKKAVRKIAESGRPLASRLVRPVIVRLRHYFIDGLREDNQAIKRIIEHQQSFIEHQQSIIERQHSEVTSRLSRIEEYSLGAVRRVAINCGPGEIMVKTEVGFVLCSPTDHALLACLLNAGELESGTRILIQHLVKPGDVYIDVGANIGMHALAAAHAMQGNGKIIAFEPFGPTKRLLEKTMWLNGFSNITEIYQAAVSDKAGIHRLNLGATSGHHSLFDLDTPEYLPSESVEVTLMSLDDTIAPDQKVNLLKIDAEGAEISVIEGAVKLIENNPDMSLIVEFGPSHLKRTGFTVESWLEIFNNLGLSYSVINSLTGALEKWTIEELTAADSVNLLFSKSHVLGATGQ